jgi:methylamine dehydrogenase accessory protein MauD
MVERYLLFDASCALCSDLAGDVERASDGKIITKSLYAPDALEMLKRARPDYKFEPTLLVAEGDKVKAYTGMAMRAQMVKFLNPLQLLKIARIVQKAGVPLFGSFEAHEPNEALVETAESEPEPEPVHEEEKPAGPTGFRLTSDGPELGSVTPVESVTTTAGETLSLAHSLEQNTILLFLSTSCPFCVKVAEALAEFAADAPERVILVFSTVDPDKLASFLESNHLTELPIVVSPETRAAFSVTGVPYGFALDQMGVVRGKGIVNNNEQLDSLANTLFVSVEAFKQALATRTDDKVVVT